MVNSRNYIALGGNVNDTCEGTFNHRRSGGKFYKILACFRQKIVT